MGPQTIQGTPQLAAAIKERRKALHLTIEEAAAKAGVGTKTWCRYEAGESIRKDKCRGICKALNWRTLPEIEASANVSDSFKLSEYHSHKAWSQNIADIFGEAAAASFAIGSDIILDHIQEDLQKLSTLPQGSHIGQVDCSILADLLPKQFLMRYDYDFIYLLNATVTQLRNRSQLPQEFLAHSVLEELALYLMVEESHFLMDEIETNIEEAWDEWIFDLFDDMDIITFLYSNLWISAENPYHFNHWSEDQFYTP